MQQLQLTPPAWWTHYCWVGLLLAVGVGLELGGAWFQVLLPGVALSTFYLGVARPWRAPMLGAMAAGTLLEVFLDRRPALLLFLPLLIWASLYYRRRGDRDNLVTLALPGALVGLAYAALLLAINNFSGGALLLSVSRLVGLLMSALILGAIGLPSLVCVADWVALVAGLPRFRHTAKGARP
jgi:hypothetical protein